MKLVLVSQIWDDGIVLARDMENSDWVMFHRAPGMHLEKGCMTEVDI